MISLCCLTLSPTLSLWTGLISCICPCDGGAAPVCWRRSSTVVEWVVGVIHSGPQSIQCPPLSQKCPDCSQWQSWPSWSLLLPQQTTDLLKIRFSSSALSRLSEGCLSFTSVASIFQGSLFSLTFALRLCWILLSSSPSPDLKACFSLLGGLSTHC